MSELPEGWEQVDRRGPPGLLPADRVPDGRYSQTLLRHRDDCHRSAWLYLRGGGRSHPLDRGTALHMVAERMMLTAIEQGESVDGDSTKAIVDEVRRDRPDLVVSAAEWDDVREMAWHISKRPLVPGGPEVEGVSIDPEKVVAVERKFLLPVGVRWVSMKLDVAAISGTVGLVWDWKSTPHIPSQDEFESTFQTKLYALGLVHGHPVIEHPCGECGGTGGELHLYVSESPPRQALEPCPVCNGRGKTEELEEPLGGRLGWVRGAELYPRRVTESGEVEMRSVAWSRLQLEEFRTDVEAIVEGIASDVADPDAPWEAARNANCSLCPSKLECPLPARLRELAGTINDPGEAAAAFEALEAAKAETAAMQTELRNWLKVNVDGWLPFGKDKVADFGFTERRETKWDEFDRALAESVTFGTPFELESVQRVSSSTPLRMRKMTPGELRERERES